MEQCSICRKKLKREDYPLSPDHAYYRICGNCSICMGDPTKHRGVLQEHLPRIPDPAVKSYVESLLQQTDLGVHAEYSHILQTGTDTLSGYTIDSYLGFISAEAAYNWGLLVLSLDNEAQAEKLWQSKQAVYGALCRQADALDANAIVGMRMQITTAAESGLCILLTGTAVRVHRDGAFATQP